MRDFKIDILRFIGLFLIILAHTNVPSIIFQLRNFDVPMMVLISGIVFSLSYRATQNYPEYLWKRVKRLVLPVWIFLSLFFVFLFVFKNNDPRLNIETVLNSYLFINGIGYVWIIRVFY